MHTAVLLCTSVLLAVVFSPPAVEARAMPSQLEVFLNSLEAKEQEEQQEQPNLKRYDDSEAQVDSALSNNKVEAPMKAEKMNIGPAQIAGYTPILDNIVTIKNFGGSLYYPQYKFLNGNTGNGKVDLVSSTVAGAVWQPEYLDDGRYAFKCLGINANPDHTYLDGHTDDGRVSLAPNTNYPYTGTHWNVFQEPDGTYVLSCAGHVYNPDHILLNGVLTDDNYNNAGDVDLESFSNWGTIGTHWEFEIY